VNRETILFLLFLTSLSSAILGIFLLSRGSARAKRFLVLALFTNAVWSFIEALLFLGFGPGLKVLLTQIQYLFIVTVPPLYFFYILTYLGHYRWLNRYSISAICLIPLLTLILAWTNGFHGLIWSNIEVVGFQGIQALLLTHGPFFWVHVSYVYASVVLLVVLPLIRAMRADREYAAQYWLLVLAVGVPVVLNCIYVFDFLPVKPLDITPLAFALTSIILALGFLYFRIQDLVPAARDLVFENFIDGILVCDGKGRIVYANTNLPFFDHKQKRQLIGTPVTTLTNHIPGIDSFIGFCGDEPCEVSSGLRSFELRKTLVPGRLHGQAGEVWVFRDITGQKELELQLREQSMTDSLTRLKNRRYFTDEAKAEIERCRRYGQDLCLLMLDLDHFKAINDSYGHDAGDRVLIMAAETILNTTRESDIPARIGGEEFAVLLPHTDEESGRQIALRLLEMVRRIDLSAVAPNLQITISVGLTSIVMSEDNLETLLKRADTALYEAKYRGRDQLVVYSEQSS
jgi:diguanylate cyclase (GGDEF)-like protein